MATAEAVRDATTCCICFEVYRDPHALPCIHTLCKPCIDELAVRGKVECPECRETSDVNKIRKDFKTQSLIDAHNGKAGESGGGSGVTEICGMCREQYKVVNSHCKECECFMCTSCEKAHKAIKVCRGHTVRALNDIFKMAKSKLEDCVHQWKMEKTKITTEANKLEISIKSIQDETEKQIELTNKHFNKLIRDLEKKCVELVKGIREANEVSLQSLRKNKDLYDQLTREIQSKIRMLQEVIDKKHASTMNNMVDDMGESLKEQVIQLRNQVDSFDLQSVVPIKMHIDKKATSIAPGIKLEITLECDIGTAQQSLMLNSNYLKLKTNRYQLSGSQDCKHENARMCIIENNIWCAAYGNGIQIYDKNMQLINEIKDKNYRSVTGLAEWCGDVIVSCYDTGLHQITQSGEFVQEIKRGKFSDVSSNGKYVYGLQSIEPPKIVIFTHERNKWTEKGEIPLKDDNKWGILDKLIANANSLFISRWEENCIEKYSLEGALQQTFGCEGTLTGSLNGPILSGVDVYDNLLVVDYKQKQLKVYYSEKKTWHVVPVKLDIEPWDAVMDENTIWVVNFGYPSKILKFTKISKYTHHFKIMAFIVLLFLLMVAVKWEIQH